MAENERFDESVSKWLEESAPARIPERVLNATFQQTRTSRQHMGWRAYLGRTQMLRFASVLGGAAVIVVVAAVALNAYLSRPGVGRPTTTDAWSRVLIETPSGGGRIVSLAASLTSLLAVLGEAGQYPNETRLAVSGDGKNWTLVPLDRQPHLISPRDLGYPAVVATDRGFLMLQLGEVWTSANGDDWRPLASSATDPDLGGSMRAGTVGGPGLVAVGEDKAWYSIDGSDWSRAVVPALPAEILSRPDSERYVEMRGVAAAGNDLVAWGVASVPLVGNSGEHLEVPLLWTSDDGLSWASVVDPEMDSITAVTGGPSGFVAAGRAGSEAAVWISGDGIGWERVGDGAFASQRSGGSVQFESAATSGAGYLLAGRDGLCGETLLCPIQDAAIWTSADGRSWTRLPSDELFGGGAAFHVVNYGSMIVVGGGSGAPSDQPAIWISDSAP